MSTLFLKTLSSVKGLMKLKHAKLIAQFAEKGIDEDSIHGVLNQTQHRLDKIGKSLGQKLIRALKGLLKLLGNPGASIEEIYSFLSRISSIMHEIACKSARMDRLKRYEMAQAIARDNTAIQDAIYKANLAYASKIETKHKQQDTMRLVREQKRAKDKTEVLFEKFNEFLEQSKESAMEFFQALTQPRFLRAAPTKGSQFNWMFDHQMKKYALGKMQPEDTAAHPSPMRFKPLAHTWPVVISR